MKKVFIDTNVLLDFVTGRDGNEDACDILQWEKILKCPCVHLI